MKYIIITGGIISGIGKGVTSSSIGFLLKKMDYNITMIKIDPYFNQNASHISPHEHGEVFVLNDGSETDLDLGTYERFLNINLTGKHNITSGKIFRSVMKKEINKKYLGQTIQIMPHITNEIKETIRSVAKIVVNKNSIEFPDICIIEIGGTIGDLESMHFIEAIKQLSFESNNDEFCFIHVGLLLKNKEYKTRPIQQSIKTLRKLGINPDILVMRLLESKYSEKIINLCKRKLKLTCQINNIIINQNTDILYEVPLILYDQQITNIICNKLNLENININLKYYRNITNFFYQSYNKIKYVIKVCIIGKYCNSPDVYLSIYKALEHVSVFYRIRIMIQQIPCKYFEKHNFNILNNYNGVIIPGGFDNRGIENMINVCTYCKIKNIPLLGICLGMQLMCIEAGRKTLYKLNSHKKIICNSLEFDKNATIPIINYAKSNKSMILGTKKIILSEFSRLSCYYFNIENILELNSKNNIIRERFRHRFMVDNFYIDLITDDNLEITGKDKNGDVMLIEHKINKFYVGCQFHPEFSSSLNNPSPLFLAFIDSII